MTCGLVRSSTGSARNSLKNWFALYIYLLVYLTYPVVTGASHWTYNEEGVHIDFPVLTLGDT